MNRYSTLFTSIPYSFCLAKIRKDFCVLSGDGNHKEITFDFYMSFCGLNKQKGTVATPTKMGHSIGDCSTHNPFGYLKAIE